ncbi:MAG: tetratricopeptide repeat protein, partial [Gammaproteobacteria bacterium]
RDIGLSLRRLGRWEESVRSFERTLELDPLNSFAAATLAETLALMNDWARLEPLVDQWLAREPNSGDFVAYKISTLINRYGDLEAAGAVLEAAEKAGGIRVGYALYEVAVYSRDWDRLLYSVRDDRSDGPLAIFDITEDFQLGEVYALMGQAETARGHLEAYLAYAAENPTTGRIAGAFRNANLAVAHARLGNDQAALAHAERASELLPLEDDHLFGSNIEQSNTWVLAMTGQRELALERIKPRGGCPGPTAQRPRRN